MVESGIRAVLVANATVAAIVGTRVYCGYLPQGVTYPCITIMPITQDDNVTLYTLPALKWARLQIDSWAATYAAMMTLHNAIFTALANQKFTPTGFDIRSIVPHPGGQYFYEDVIEKHRRTRDYGVWWKTA